MTRWQKFWWYWVPLLYVDIRLPFFSIRTAGMVFIYERNELLYTAFDIRLFKWEINVDWYSNDRQRWLRERSKCSHD